MWLNLYISGVGHEQMSSAITLTILNQFRSEKEGNNAHFFEHDTQ